MRKSEQNLGYLNRGCVACTPKLWKSCSANVKKQIDKIHKSLLLLVLLSFVGCREQIVHNLSEVEANRLLTRLHDVAIEANKERQPDGKWLIETASSDSLRAIKYLDDSRVFRQEIGAEENNPSVLPNREEQRARAARRLAKEIEFSLRSINGVLESHVHLNLPPLDPLFGQKITGAPSSASVVAVVDKSTGVQAADIAQLVSGATGVEIKSIAVLLTPGAVERETIQLVQPIASTTSKPAEIFGVEFKQVLLICAVALLVVATLIAATLLRSKVPLTLVKQ